MIMFFASELRGVAASCGPFGTAPASLISRCWDLSFAQGRFPITSLSFSYHPSVSAPNCRRSMFCLSELLEYSGTLFLKFLTADQTPGLQVS